MDGDPATTSGRGGVHLQQRPRRVSIAGFSLLVSVSFLTLPAFATSSLIPTHAALVRQSLGAREAGLTYLDNDVQVHEAVRTGQLVTLQANDDYFIHEDVRFSAARPEVKLFVERLAHQYRAACGDRLVVTSLVRPRSRQPWNSDPLSVHPTGMAVDLRIPQIFACRRWIEKTLLDLEDHGVIEAARERVVPHYHVVVFPAYRDDLERNGVQIPTGGSSTLLASVTTSAESLPTPLVPVSAMALSDGPTMLALPVAQPPVPTTTTASATHTVAARATASHHRTVSTRGKQATHARSTRSATRPYKVRRGDTLWTIAKRHGVTVAAIKSANRVHSGLRPGQLLSIPAR
jgi:LysM repeat protein